MLLAGLSVRYFDNNFCAAPFRPGYNLWSARFNFSHSQLG